MKQKKRKKKNDSNKIYAFNKSEIKRKRKRKFVAGKLLQINYTETYDLVC